MSTGGRHSKLILSFLKSIKLNSHCKKRIRLKIPLIVTIVNSL